MKCGIGEPLVQACSSHYKADGNLLWDSLCQHHRSSQWECVSLVAVCKRTPFMLYATFSWGLFSFCLYFFVHKSLRSLSL